MGVTGGGTATDGGGGIIETSRSSSSMLGNSTNDWGGTWSLSTAGCAVGGASYGLGIGAS